MAYLRCIYFVVAFSVLSLVSAYDLIQNENLESNGYGCLCSNYSCGCCAHLEAPTIGLNDTACVNITYLPKEYGISFTVTLDKLAIYNETISARNPPPICFGAPYLKEFADLCVHFHDIDATATKLHGCVDVEARMHRIVIARYEIGCFNLGHLKKNLGRWNKYHLELIENIRSRQKTSYNKI